jgi:hypothetical protein
MARALRKLSPDSALFRRRARGESLRNLARDYDVEHTSLSRYFRTEQGARSLRQAEQELEAKRKGVVDFRACGALACPQC